MTLTESICKLAVFFGAETKLDWIEHLLDTDFKCGCSRDGVQEDHAMDGSMFGVCKEWAEYKQYDKHRAFYLKVKAEFERLEERLRQKGKL